MNLQQLLTTVPVSDIVAAHNAAYEQHVITEEFYRETFLPLITNRVLVQTGWKITLDHIQRKHDDPSADEEYFDVGCEDPEGNHFSFSFTPWSEILAYEVTSRCHFLLTDAQVAAHMYWELTWHGMEEDAEARGDEIKDRAEEVSRLMEEHDKQMSEGSVDRDTLPTGLKVFNIDDYRDSLDAESIAELDAIRANLRTEKCYINGVLSE